MMSTEIWKPASCIILGFLVSACDVEKTEQGDMPDIDVEYESGNMPEYDVDWVNVDVGTRTETVTVPKIGVYTEEEQVDVPYIDIGMPDNGESDQRSQVEERSVVVEIEVSDTKPELNIESVYASDRRLFIVSRLTETGTPLGGERVRISDRLMLNAPDLEIKHVIVGERPEGNWNQQYKFVADEEAMMEYVGADATQIYGS